MTKRILELEKDFPSEIKKVLDDVWNWPRSDNMINKFVEVSVKEFRTFFPGKIWLRTRELYYTWENFETGVLIYQPWQDGYYDCISAFDQKRQRGVAVMRILGLNFRPVPSRVYRKGLIGDSPVEELFYLYN